MARLFAPFVLLLALVLGALALDDDGAPADFVFVNRGEIFTLDPQRMSWMQDLRMAGALYEPLIRWNTDDFTFAPAAADLPDISPDGLVYTFRLREDARWSNGAPLTAHDYIWTWQRALLPDTAADYSMLFFAIDGAEAFFNWRREALAAFAERDGADPRDAFTLWRETEQRFHEIVGLRALDDRTLEIRLHHPVPYFLDFIAFGSFHPVYRPCVEGWRQDPATWETIRARGWHAVEAPSFSERRWARLDPASGRYEQSHEWTKPAHIVGNGPYILTDWRYRRGLRLSVNPHYHSPEIIRSRTIRIISIEDSNTAVMAFEAGGIDWLSEVATDYQSDMLRDRAAYDARHHDEMQHLRDRGFSYDEALAHLPPPGPGERRAIHAYPTFGTDFYSFNCRPLLHDGRTNPFHDARVRRAFVLATDRQMLVDQVTRLNEPVATTLIPPDSIPGYVSPEGLGHDPAQARAELAAAGWIDRRGDGVLRNERGEPFPTVDVLFSTNTPRYRNLSLALRDMWQRELGVSVELRGKDNKSFREDLKGGNFMIGRGRWYGDYGDPTTFLDIFRTNNGNNDRGYSNPRVEALLDEAARERDPARRMALLGECERFLFAEESPMLILCTLVQLYMYDPVQVRGLTHHPRLAHYLWQLERIE